MSRVTAGDGVVPRDDDDDDDKEATALVFVDHVPPPPPSPARRTPSWRLPPGSAASAPGTDPSASVPDRPVRNNNSRVSPSPRPLPRLSPSIANTTMTPPRTSARRPSTTLRRKSVTAGLVAAAVAAPPQPVSPEPDLHRRVSTATPLRRPDGGMAYGVGYRLGRRKVLAERRKRIADYSLVFAMFGVVTMVVEMELTMAELYDKV